MDNLDKSLCRIIVFAIFCLAFAFMLPVPTYGQADMLNPGDMTQVMPGVDDGTAHVPLGHAFPYMGGVFTDAWMSSNGFILFYDPTKGFGNSSTWNNGCCSGFDPSGYDYGGNSYSYMLAPLWTDLMDPDGTGEAGYYYKTDEGSSSFLWYNVLEFGTSNTNTFQVDLYSGGSFDFIYDEVDITQHSVWIGFTGDTAKIDSSGKYVEVNELMYAQGGMDEFDIEFHSQTLSGGRAWYGDDGGYGAIDAGPDCSNPLNDTSCEGYDEAYYAQQCDANSLYDSGCSGYEQAYYEQQCSADSLYDSGCPGYAEAFYSQQCTLDSLYDDNCPGYAEAFYSQQCTLDSLYDSGCPGYAEAYLEQQCELDSLSSPSCPNYATESALLALEEALFEDNSMTFDEPEMFQESFEEEITPIEDDMSTFQENVYMSEENVDEMYMPEEFVEPIEEIEEEIAILEEMEVIDVLEEDILEEAVAIETEIEEISEKPGSTKLAVSLSLSMAADLVANLEAKEAEKNETQSNESSMSQNEENQTENEAFELVQEQDSSQNIEFEDQTSEISTNGDIFSSDTDLFFSLTGDSQSESAESVSNNEQTEQNVQNEQQNLALGDAAPIGFSIVPLEAPTIQLEIVEEKSLAEQMAEAVAEKNKEESNKAAVGQTAMLNTLASGTDFGDYYGTSYNQTKQFYNEEKIYDGIVLTDNYRTHYNMFSGSHGKMYKLIRSQYND